jgi:hypothetical protein
LNDDRIGLPADARAAAHRYDVVVIAASLALAAWLALVSVCFLLWHSFLTPETTCI